MAHEIVEQWRKKAPRVPSPQQPPRTPSYDVQEIQSINPTPKKLAEYARLESLPHDYLYVPATGSTMARRELTPQEMGGLYPELVSKRPELLKRLSNRGVTYYVDPLASQRHLLGMSGTYDPNVRLGGYYDPRTKEVTIQKGQPALVAGHEIVHADLATGPTNIVRFLTDSKYRAMRIADVLIEDGRWSGYVELLSGYGEKEIGQGGLASEVFAMGAGGSTAYMDQPVDYTDANRLFGGTFDPGYVRTTGGRTQPSNRGVDDRYRWRSYSPVRGR